MIVLSNSEDIKVGPAESIPFDLVTLQTKCGAECHKPNSPSVKLKCRGIYQVAFSGTIFGGAPDDPSILQFTLDGEPIYETKMVSTNVNDTNVSKITAISNCCCDYNRVSVTNTGDSPLTIRAGSAFYITRKA